MPRTLFSLCVVTYNEERKLRDCLASASFADEIVVVDSGSTDGTLDIAREFDARVVSRPWPGHVQQKNFAVDAARHDWVLSLDADERLSPELAEEIRRALSASPPEADAYSMPRRSWYLGGWFTRGGWYPDRKLRLFDRRKARWAGENPHDRVHVQGREAELTGDILHYVYRDLSHHLAVINSYSSIASREKSDKGVPWAPARLVLHPFVKFWKVWLFQGAWREGTRGFVMAVMGAFSVFMKYAKLWERTRGLNRQDAPPPGG